MNDFTNNQSISRFADQLIRHYKIPFRSTKKAALNAVLNQIGQKVEREQRKNRIIRLSAIGISTAAVIVIALTFWFFTATVMISATSDGILSCRLPDESRVVLHPNSQLKFSRYNWKRTVYLQGEAYFEVEKGDGFEVITSLGKVEVLGTRFLVSDNEIQLSVNCYEGRVKTRFRENTWILEPYTQFSGEEDKTVKRSFNEKIIYPQFAKFQRNFNNEEVIKVVREIESFFNVEIEVQNGLYKRFSGSVQTGSLESALQIISESLQLTYHFSKNDEIIILKKRD